MCRLCCLVQVHILLHHRRICRSYLWEGLEWFASKIHVYFGVLQAHGRIEGTSTAHVLGQRERDPLGLSILGEGNFAIAYIQ